MTNNQKLIYDYFLNNPEVLISANEVIKKFENSMDRATIYRQLNKLEAKNILTKTFNNEQNLYNYHLADNCEHHLHLTCIKCGRTIHLQDQRSRELVQEIIKNNGFAVDLKTSVINGICEECQKENK